MPIQYRIDERGVIGKIYIILQAGRIKAVNFSHNPALQPLPFLIWIGQTSIPLDKINPQAVYQRGVRIIVLFNPIRDLVGLAQEALSSIDDATWGGEAINFYALAIEFLPH